MKMVKVNIDGNEVEVPEGISILEAAERVGIEIPHLCYLEGLPVVGACRLCLVELEGARGLVAACARKVRENMVIRTGTERVIEARKFILELLWSIHHGDCTTCEKSGACDLQRYTYDLQIDKNKYSSVETRKFELDKSSYLIERDPNLCILCGRCIRACQLYGNYVIDFQKRGLETIISTPANVPLQDAGCTFCGSCISVCPVGALVERKRKFRGREWEFVPTKTICIHCGCTCSLYFDTVNDQIVRARPLNPNAYICARGRFGWDYTQNSKRLTTPLINKGDGKYQPVSWTEALSYIAEQFKKLKLEHGANAVAGIITANSSYETFQLFHKFFTECIGNSSNNGGNIDSFASTITKPLRICFDKLFNGNVPEFATLTDISNADVVLVINTDALINSPAVWCRIKEGIAQRNNTNLIVIDSRENEVTRKATTHLKLNLGTECLLLDNIIKCILDMKLYNSEFVNNNCEGFETFQTNFKPKIDLGSVIGDAITTEQIETVAKVYADKDKKAVIVWSVTENSNYDLALRILTLLMLTGRVNRGMFLCEPFANIGAVFKLFNGTQKLNQKSVIETLLRGNDDGNATGTVGTNTITTETTSNQSIQGLYIIGENPLRTYPNKSALKNRLAKLEFLVVQDLFMTDTAELAHVILPAPAFTEIDGTVVNAEGKDKVLAQVYPLPAGIKPISEILNELASDITGSSQLTAPPETAFKPIEAPVKYKFVVEEFDKPVKLPPTELLLTDDYPYLLMLTPTLFSSFDCIQQTVYSELSNLEQPALTTNIILINPKDADKLELKAGDIATVNSTYGTLNATVKVDSNLPEGLCTIPRICPDANNLTCATILDTKFIAVNIRKKT